MILPIDDDYDYGRELQALLAERERIAMGLSRDTIHRLFGIGLKLQSLSSTHADSAASAALDDCVHELDVTISDLRGIVFNLGSRNV